MADIIDYLDWRGDLSFEASPFCDVDNLIFSQLVYIDFDEAFEGDVKEITLSEAAENMFYRYPDGIIPQGLMTAKSMNELLRKSAESERFGKVRLFLPQSRIDEVNQEQFYAVTFIIGDGSAYVAFRGTDHTIVGWKEDFNMGFICPVPSQYEAVRYLQQVAGERSERLIIGGHSKGGNLAVYSAAFSDGIADRIIKIHSNDGPGFPPEIVEDERFTAVLPKIKAIVPQGSVVGMLLEHRGDVYIVGSEQRGILQHDGFSWKVLGNRFIELDSRSADSLIVDKALTSWLSNLSNEERESFVTELYNLISVSEAQTLSELTADIPKLLKGLHSISPQTRETISRALSSLRAQTLSSTKEFARELIEKKEVRGDRLRLPKITKKDS